MNRYNAYFCREQAGIIRNPWYTKVYRCDDYYLNDALAVYNGDGDKVGEIPCSGEQTAGFWVNGFHDVNPIYCNSMEDGLHFYSFTDSNGVFAPKDITTLSGYPNPLPKGEPFTVELPRPSDNGTFVTVSDMNGRQVYRSRIAPGNESSSFRLRNASDGLLIYTVIYGDGTSVSGRLIAK